MIVSAYHYYHNVKSMVFDLHHHIYLLVEIMISLLKPDIKHMFSKTESQNILMLWEYIRRASVSVCVQFQTNSIKTKNAIKSYYFESVIVCVFISFSTYRNAGLIRTAISHTIDSCKSDSPKQWG